MKQLVLAGADVDATDRSGRSALALAAADGHDAVVRAVATAKYGASAARPPDRPPARPTDQPTDRPLARPPACPTDRPTDRPTGVYGGFG